MKCCEKPKYRALMECSGKAKDKNPDGDEWEWEMDIYIDDITIINVFCENCGTLFEMEHVGHEAHVALFPNKGEPN